MNNAKQIPKKEDSADSQFEVLSKLTIVHGDNLSQNITSDYVMAHLSVDDQVYIKETYENAGFIKFIVEKIAEKSFVYKWDKENSNWFLDIDKKPKKFPLNDLAKQYIKLNAKYLFDSLMISPDILVILKRNNMNNHLLNILGDVKQVDESGNEVRNLDDEKEVIAKLKKKLTTANE